MSCLRVCSHPINDGLLYSVGYGQLYVFGHDRHAVPVLVLLSWIPRRLLWLSWTCRHLGYHDCYSSCCFRSRVFSSNESLRRFNGDRHVSTPEYVVRNTCCFGWWAMPVMTPALSLVLGWSECEIYS